MRRFGVLGWPVGPQPLAGDARAASARSGCASATSACRCRRSCSTRPSARSPRRGLPRRQRHDPAQGGGARARRRGDATRARAIGAANTLTFDARRRDPRRQHRRARACWPRSAATCRRDGARARRGGSARAVVVGAARRPARRRRGLEPHAASGPRSWPPSWRGRRRRARSGRGARQLHERRAGPIVQTRSRTCRWPPMSSAQYATVVDLVYRAGGTALLASGAASRGARPSTAWRSWCARAR